MTTPRAQGPEFSQMPLFEMPSGEPVAEIQAGDTTPDAQVDTTDAAVTRNVVEGVQLTLDKALHDQSRRAMLGSGAVKWVPISERLSYEPTKVLLPEEDYRKRGFSAVDALALDAIRREDVRQANGRSRRLSTTPRQRR